MSSGLIIIPNFMPAEDSNGVRLPGALMYFYLNNTTTPTVVYADAALSVPHTNPVVADSAGVFPAIYASSDKFFSVALTTSSGVPIASYSGVTTSGATAVLGDLLVPAGAQTDEPFRLLAEGQSNMTQSPGGTNGDFTIPANVRYIAPGMLAPEDFTTYTGGYFNGKNHLALAFALALRNAALIPESRTIEIVIESLGGQSIVQWDGPTAPFITEGESLAALMGWETYPGSGLYNPAHCHLVSQGEADADPASAYGPVDTWVAAREAWVSAREAKGLIGLRTKQLQIEIAEWNHSTVANYPDVNRKLYVWAKADPMRRAIISASGTVPNTPTSADASHYSGASKDLMMRRAVSQFLDMSAFNYGYPISHAVDQDGQPIIYPRVVRVGNLQMTSLGVLDGGTGYTNGDMAWVVGGDTGNPLISGFEYRCRVQLSVTAGVITAATPVVPDGDSVSGGHYATFPTSPFTILPDTTGGSGATFNIAGVRSTNTDTMSVFFGPQDIANLGAIIAASNVGCVFANGDAYQGYKSFDFFTYSLSGGNPKIYVRNALRGPTGMLITETDTLTSNLNQSLAYYRATMVLGQVRVENAVQTDWRITPVTERIVSPGVSATYAPTALDYSRVGEVGTVIRTESATINMVLPSALINNINLEIRYENLSGTSTFAMADASTGKFQTLAGINGAGQVLSDTFTEAGYRKFGTIRTDGTSWVCPESLNDAGIVFNTYTAAQIADKTHAVNTLRKRIGLTVRDSTNKRLMVADGTANTSTWTVADGSATVTPA